jgi:hypothetical protein
MERTTKMPLVTGANRGMGLETLNALTRSEKHWQPSVKSARRLRRSINWSKHFY